MENRDSVIYPHSCYKGLGGADLSTRISLIRAKMVIRNQLLKITTVQDLLDLIDTKK